MLVHKMSNDTNFHLHSAGWRIARNMGEGSSETGIAAAVPACLLLPLPPPRGSRYSGCVCEGCGSREWGVRKWESIYYTKHLPTALGVVQALLPLLAVFISQIPFWFVSSLPLRLASRHLP